MPVPAVGNLVTPANFTIQSAQGAILLSWSASVGANIYYINRSTDNVTFTNIDSTSSVSYADMSGILGAVTQFTSSFSIGVSSITVSSTTGLMVGQQVTDFTNGANIPSGTVITSITGLVIGLSKATTGTCAKDILQVGPQVYYYQVQAGNGLVSSLPTPSLSGVFLKPGQTTLGNIRLQSKQRSDRVKSLFVTDQEWNTYISDSYKELYDILKQKFGDDYFVAIPYAYTTSGTIDPTTQASLYPLPNDFYALLRVEVALNPSDPNSWVTLRQFMFIQGNLWNFPNVYTFYGITNLRYRLNGNNLMIVPIPSGGQTIRIWYVPRPNQLFLDTQLVDGVSGWEEYVVVDAVIKALAKQESDVSIFMSQKMALIKRIEEAAANRNIGEPQTVSDSKLRNFAWSDDNTWSGGSY